MNEFLKKRDAKVAAQYQYKLDIMQQIGMDAAVIAAHEVLGMGPGRALAFCTKYMKTINELASLVVEDAKDDTEIVYAQESIDRDIKRIVGEENFDPWAVRYSMMNRFRKGKKK